MTGSIRQLVLFDIAEEIYLELVGAALKIPTVERSPAFSRPAPDYVRFERAPVVEPIQLEGVEGRVKYYEYGVISVEIDRRFDLSWVELVEKSSKWLSDPSIEKQAREIVRQRVNLLGAAMLKPYAEWLTEDYAIMTVPSGEMTANTLLAERGAEIAQIVRVENRALSDSETQEILQARLSYYPNDLIVVGWSAAFVYDTPESAEVTVQLLEYANTQLLEFRYYDDLLTSVLTGVYKTMDRGSGIWQRWGLAQEAEKLNTIRLDITELAERTETSIKFLSDMFYARMYRLAATRVGVPDYRRLVNTKLHAAADLYELMVDRFDRSRAFVLEVLVVIILLIEIVFLFKGKS